MKPTRYPTRLNLKDLLDQGENYHYTKASGELNDALKDLISSNDFKVELHLRPMGNAFEITGKIATEMDLSCTRCGRDMKYPILDDFRELIVVESARPPGGHSGHTGLGFEDGPYCNYVTGYEFDLAEFVHEHLALAEPYVAHCGRTDCETFFKKISSKNDTTLEPEATNPFQVLKNLEPKRQKG